MNTPSTFSKNDLSSEKIQNAFDEAMIQGNHSQANAIIAAKDIIDMLEPEHILGFGDLSLKLEAAMLLCSRRAKEDRDFR